MRERTLSLFLLGLFMVMMIAVTPVYADGETSPIYINDNGDFVTFSDSGNGSPENPYLISGEILEDYGTACIYIANTDVYAIIDNAVLRGTGYYGIYLENVSNVNITNSVINDKMAGILIDNCNRILVNNVDIYNCEANDYGIKIDLSNNIGVANCYIEDALAGLCLMNSFRIAILNNEFVGCGISFDGTCQVSTGVLITGNTVNSKPLYYLYNKHDVSYDISMYGQAILVNCVNVTLYNGDISDTSIGVQFIFSQNCVIALSNFTNNYYGVLIYESSYSRIYANNFTGNVFGLGGYMAVGSIVDENNFVNNLQYGIWVRAGCSSSTIYLNNFIGNVIGNARDDGSIQDSKKIWAAIKFINPISGWPLNNVSVTLAQGDLSYTGYSNELGIFKVPLPNLGPYNITIERFRYETKNIINYANIQEGINIYNIGLIKADLGPGTGYGLVRFEDDGVGVGGVTVKVYSYLDGAYYFHSQYVSTTTTPVGWVNITGLYYDNYIFVVTHPDYEREIIQQVVIADGIASWSGYRMQLTAYPTDAFVYGNVYDGTNELPLENANITIINEVGQHAHFFTDVNGFFNITNIHFGVYQVEISLSGYLTYMDDLIIDTGGSQLYNPILIWLYPTDYVPEMPLDSVVNSWDNELYGNYWDTLVSPIVLASEIGIYEIPGNNLDNPVDKYPLSVPHIRNIVPVITDTTVDTITIPIIIILLMSIGMLSIVIVVMSEKKWG